MGDFFSFRRMITPLIIQFRFIAGALFSIVAGMLLFGRNGGLGLLLILIVPLFWRVICENAIVFFRMNESLTDIRAVLREQRISASPQVAMAVPIPSFTPTPIAAPQAAPRGIVAASTSVLEHSGELAPQEPQQIATPRATGPLAHLLTEPPEVARIYNSSRNEALGTIVAMIEEALRGAEVRCRPVTSSDAFQKDAAQTGSPEVVRTIFVRHLIRMQQASER